MNSRTICADVESDVGIDNVTKYNYLDDILDEVEIWMSTWKLMCQRRRVKEDIAIQ